MEEQSRTLQTTKTRWPFNSGQAIRRRRSRSRSGPPTGRRGILHADRGRTATLNGACAAPDLRIGALEQLVDKWILAQAHLERQPVQ